ncbi:hypothetical protein AALC75_06345 [Lachnospiraceae bacterium 48-42]
MKIYGDYTFLLDKLNVWNNSQVKIIGDGTRIVQFADKFLEEQRAAFQDEVSISREGMEYLRDSLSDLSSTGGSLRHYEPANQPEAGGSLSLMDGLCRTYILQRLDTENADGVSTRLYNGLMTRYEEELKKKDASDLSSHGESLARAYADMKKTIEEGYEKGTREVWIMEKGTDADFSGVEFEIDGSAVRYRRLSKEEELQKLDKAFEQLTQDVAKEFAQTKSEEADSSDQEMTDSEKEFWTLANWIDGLINEIERFLKLIEQEEAAKNKEEPLDLGARLTAEMRSHGVETVSRGRQEAQYANYRKMSRMVADVQTFLGNIRA